MFAIILLFQGDDLRFRRIRSSTLLYFIIDRISVSNSLEIESAVLLVSVCFLKLVFVSERLVAKLDLKTRDEI